jgi:single-strand DNA-binding protein
MAMSLDNQITLRGYVTAEPRLWQTKNNTTGAEVRVGSTPRWLNRETGEWQEGEPTYYTIKCWRNLAINVKGSLHKGDRVIVRGKFTTRAWVDEQQRPRVQIEVEADSVGHDLAFAWSFVNRGTRAPRNAMEGLANGEMARADLDGSDGTDGSDLVHEDVVGENVVGGNVVGDQAVGDSGSDGLPPLPAGPDDYSDEFSPAGEAPAEMSAEAMAEATAEAVPF